MSSLFQRIKEIENTEATPCNQSELIEPLDLQRMDAEIIPIKKVVELAHFMPVYQTASSGDTFWLSGCLSSTEEAAINSVKWVHDLTKLRLVKITLPVRNIPAAVEV